MGLEPIEEKPQPPQPGHGPGHGPGRRLEEAEEAEETEEAEEAAASAMRPADPGSMACLEQASSSTEMPPDGLQEMRIARGLCYLRIGQTVQRRPAFQEVALLEGETNSKKARAVDAVSTSSPHGQRGEAEERERVQKKKTKLKA